MDKKIEELQKKAIDAAIANNWDEAIVINKNILLHKPNNIDSLLAFGFALMQTDCFDEAQKIYKKVLRLEPGNQIAHHNIDKISILKNRKGQKDSSRIIISPDDFVNIPGKTKVIELVNIGQADILAKLKIGEQVVIRIKKHRVELRSFEDEYLGVLPDDISRRLIYLIGAGSSYDVYVKSSLRNSIEVFIIERKKGVKVKQFISFPTNIQEDLKKICEGCDDEDEHEDKEDSETEEKKEDEDEDDEDESDMAGRENLDIESISEDYPLGEPSYSSDDEEFNTGYYKDEEEEE